MRVRLSLSLTDVISNVILDGRTDGTSTDDYNDHRGPGLWWCSASAFSVCTPFCGCVRLQRRFSDIGWW